MITNDDNQEANQNKINFNDDDDDDEPNLSQVV